MDENNTPITPEAEITETPSFLEENSPPTLPEEAGMLPLDADAAPENEAAFKAESKTRRFFRRFIRWSAGLLIVFGFGLITGIFVLYRPAIKDSEQVRQLSASESASAQEQIASLETQVTELKAEITRLQSLEGANATLSAQQQEYELEIAILDVRLDVSSALNALAAEDGPRARITLEKTSETLNALQALLDAEQQGVIATMQQRLELVMSEIEDDPYAAQSDLNVLAANLLQLQDALFAD